MKSHDQIMGDAKDAIEELFSDTSVSQSQTREDLEELRDDINAKIEAINADLDRAHEEANR
jgi:hypothetical protein